jgi:hypothetical protein
MQTTKPRKKRPTAAETAAENYEKHVRESIPFVESDRQAHCLFLDSDALQIIDDVDLTEFAFGCRSRLLNATPPVLFRSADDKDDSAAQMFTFIDSIETINKANWGYPDGYTAIIMIGASQEIIRDPFVVARHGVPSEHNFHGHVPDSVFVFPGPEGVVGTFAASSTCNLIEWVCTYDRVMRCVTPPPLGLMHARDRKYKERYSELHMLVWLEHPPTAAELSQFVQAKWVSEMDDNSELHPLQEFTITPPIQSHGNDSTTTTSTSTPPIVIPPPIPYSQRQESTSLYNLLIAPPDHAVVQHMELTEFQKVLSTLNCMRMINIVISHPTSLLDPESVIHLAQEKFTQWSLSDNIIKPQIETQEEEEEATLTLPQVIAQQAVPSSVVCTKWNASATVNDITALWRLATPANAAIISGWIQWRMYATDPVVLEHADQVKALGAKEVWAAAHTHKLPLLTQPIFHHVSIMAMAAEYVVQCVKETDTTQ